MNPNPQAKMVGGFGRRLLLVLDSPTPSSSSSSLLFIIRRFRCDAALEAIRKASESKTPNLVLYNYPSFSASFAALFAYLYHSKLNLPCLILPFSSHIPFTVDDLCVDGMSTCYLLDFLGPKDFALQLSSNTSSKVVGFDHRKSMLSRMEEDSDFNANVNFNLNLHKTTCVAVYEYFSAKLDHIKQETDDDSLCLLNQQDRDRLEIILKYIEVGDVRNSTLPDFKAFHIGLKPWRSKLNCITNPNMYQQLMQLCPVDLITKGNAYLSSQKTDVYKLLHKVFKVSLGRGFYGECLGVRADGNSVCADELAKELSRRSAAAGLRPIGAVIYMQRTNLKMCLRTTDSSTNTSEIAKAYGGGGSPSSSSFIIRMDEYNLWLSRQSSSKC